MFKYWWFFSFYMSKENLTIAQNFMRDLNRLFFEQLSGRILSYGQAGATFFYDLDSSSKIERFGNADSPQLVYHNNVILSPNDISPLKYESSIPVLTYKIETANSLIVTGPTLEALPILEKKEDVPIARIKIDSSKYRAKKSSQSEIYFHGSSEDKTRPVVQFVKSVHESLLQKGFIPVESTPGKTLYLPRTTLEEALR